MDHKVGFDCHIRSCRRGSCTLGSAQCCICMKSVPHADWWVLNDEGLDSLAVVCSEDAELYSDHIPVAVRTIQQRWASLATIR